MRKKVLLLALALALVLGAAGAGTYAYFQDAGHSSGNTFTSGTLDLQLCDADEAWGNGVSATWAIPRIAPGETVNVIFEVGLRNTGSIAGNRVRISFQHAIDEAANPVEADTNPNSAPGDMARYVEILQMDYNGQCLVGPSPTPGHAIVDANGNGWLDLEDVTLPANASALDNLSVPLPGGGNAKNFHIALGFRPEAGNDIQGDVLLTTVAFTLQQDTTL